MDITIRPVQTLAEYRAVEQVQLAAWGMEPLSVVPLGILVTAHRHGGLVLGAFTNTNEHDNTGLVGFAFSFIGRTETGELKHCSHMTAVMPAYQNTHIGYRLKCAQREHILAQGYQLITWTFDPLLSRNAHFNFHKLGSISHTYLRNIYGTTFNSGLPTDRFEVAWYITNPHVIQHLDQTRQQASIQTLRERGVPMIDPIAANSMANLSNHIALAQLLVQIPKDIAAIKRKNIDEAQMWRYRTRELFETAFACGYTVTDLLMDQESAWYLLERY
jgi:predicted GNAT superfamily acetyltransferase